MSELLPCPWCGHNAFVAVREVPNPSHGGTWWQAGCKGCGVSFPLGFQRDGAVREWNNQHRVPAPAPGVGVTKAMVDAALLASDRTTTRLYHDTDPRTVRRAAMCSALEAALAGEKP